MAFGLGPHSLETPCGRHKNYMKRTWENDLDGRILLEQEFLIKAHDTQNGIN